MQVLPYLIILAILPLIQRCKNIQAKTVTRGGNKITTENLYQATEIQQIMMQIIMENFHGQVEMKDFLRILSKKENYENQKYLRRAENVNYLRRL